LFSLGYMSNGPHKAAFWADFIPEHRGFPNPQRLRTHFERASFSDFCDCGCNSFKVHVPPEPALHPIAPPSNRGGAIFESDFYLDEPGRTLEIILFADARGYLNYVEVDCCANSYPVPEIIRVKEPPYHVHPIATLAP
jgi:hypothetical protein